MGFKFGDILVNHYAGDKNPCKKLIYIKRSGSNHKTFCADENDFWDMPIRDNRLEKVGSILKKPLEELMKIQEEKTNE